MKSAFRSIYEMNTKQRLERYWATFMKIRESKFEVCFNEFWRELHGYTVIINDRAQNISLSSQLFVLRYGL